jgi:hypothetical protein
MIAPRGETGPTIDHEHRRALDAGSDERAEAW